MRYAVIGILAFVFLAFGRPDYLADPAVSPWVKAISYHLYHANIFHLAANSLSIWYVFKVTQRRTVPVILKEFLTACVIATLTYFTATRPVIGFSNILFAMMGLRTPSFRNPWWRSENAIVFFTITLLMLLVPRFSALTHITSFICGTATAAATRWLKTLDNDYRHATGR